MTANRAPMTRRTAISAIPFLISGVMGLARRGDAQPPAEQAKRLAIVLDDGGANRNNPDLATRLGDARIPCSVAVIPHTPYERQTIGALKGKGIDLLLHQPMEAIGDRARWQRENPHNAHGIYADDTLETAWVTTAQNLAYLGTIAAGMRVVGVNNHRGSAATAQRNAMLGVMHAFKERMAATGEELLFLDSRTSDRSVAYRVAQEQGIRAYRRDAFIDAVQGNEDGAFAYDALIAAASRLRSGPQEYSVVIGHLSNEKTIEAMRAAKPELERSGVLLTTITGLPR